ncbi:MAG: hypothetical protein JNN00_01820 [Chitinophagaceae bacterium]|nr:hypothetical protein [Chitinophagaceae bacterium]
MKKYIAGLAIIATLFTACQKKTDPVDVSNATVTLSSQGPKFVVDDITVNPGDSIYFSFTISTNRPMKYVGIQKNPVNQTAFVTRDTLNPLQASYTTVKKLRADTANGQYLYRIVAHDSGGVYIGSKDIVVTVTPDYYNYTYRFLRVPDTTDKTNTCYMDAELGKVFNYTTGAANSATIDFGVMFDTTGMGTVSTTDDLKFCLYSLNAAQGQLPYYDISAWTKNATTMKKATSPTFASLTSAGGLRSAANTNLASGTSNKVTQLVAGNLVFFRTANGKAGCLQVNFANGSTPAKDSYLNVDVKIER